MAMPRHRSEDEDPALQALGGTAALRQMGGSGGVGGFGGGGLSSFGARSSPQQFKPADVQGEGDAVGSLLEKVRELTGKSVPRHHSDDDSSDGSGRSSEGGGSHDDSDSWANILHRNGGSSGGSEAAPAPPPLAPADPPNPYANMLS